MRARVFAACILALLCCMPARADDKYACFAELARHETPMQDFTITMLDREQPGRALAVAVIAIHGGAIERGTSELARALAGGDFSLYTFEGVKPRSNAGLHVTSTHFDEPQALKLVAAHAACLSLHGCSGMKPRVHVGGRDGALGKRVARCLREAGFSALLPGDPGFAAHLGGTSPHNICNLTSTGQGVQLEISTGLRAQLYADWKSADPPVKTTVAFARFVDALRLALAGP
jgi:phage replication-related protein YjqB (UPF0714/DUF867 family)